MTNILFLDFDGVLNSGDNSIILNFLAAHNPKKGLDTFAGIEFDERCVRWLQWIIDNTGAKIVISSSWRLHYELEQMKAIWKQLALPGEIIGYTPFETGLSALGDYEIERKFERGKEIQSWLNANKVDNYCIIDDEYEMLPDQVFVQTDPEFGLTYETAKLVVEYLKRG